MTDTPTFEGTRISLATVKQKLAASHPSTLYPMGDFLKILDRIDLPVRLVKEVVEGKASSRTMPCKFCQSEDTVCTRAQFQKNKYISRSYTCNVCKGKFTTNEHLVIKQPRHT